MVGDHLQPQHPVDAVALFGREGVECVRRGFRKRVEQGVPVLLVPAYVLLPASEGPKLALGGFSRLVQLGESRAQLVEGYEVGRHHLLVARPLAARLRQPVRRQPGLFAGVAALAAALELDHGVEVAAELVRILEGAGYLVPDASLQPARRQV